ncbi:hypothetical protein Q5M87_06980 [Brachyspira innocens]|uniref:Uncharacterized protein n=1 Tax=Brachyspira innocens TaxID=13264 RepID=A0ABT8YXK6_9SPIR|nr:hypothetical protein [Brachyspira innocens]MDO6993753.1 hypothetical protein [Brachyspira innocens]MDO7020593.1 hypothetical protein [Brachyspira innocens]
MDKIIKHQKEEIAFKWDGILNADIQKAIDLKLAFLIPNQQDDISLFVKTGEYQTAKKKEPARIKYTNVPVGYWVVIDDFVSDKDGSDIKYMKKAKIIKDKNFSSKYHIISDEPSLFDDTEENQTEEEKEVKELQGELKKAVKNFSDKTGIKVEVC